MRRKSEEVLGRARHDCADQARSREQWRWPVGEPDRSLPAITVVAFARVGLLFTSAPRNMTTRRFAGSEANREGAAPRQAASEPSGGRLRAAGTRTPSGRSRTPVSGKHPKSSPNGGTDSAFACYFPLIAACRLGRGCESRGANGSASAITSHSASLEPVLATDDGLRCRSRLGWRFDQRSPSNVWWLDGYGDDSLRGAHLVRRVGGLYRHCRCKRMDPNGLPLLVRRDQRPS